MNLVHPELRTPPPLPNGGLRVVALGGLGEIGRNMTLLEHDGRLLVVDCGLLFPEEHQPGVDVILPDFTAIRDRLDASRRSCSPTDTRTTSAASPTCCASGPTSPWSARG